MYLAKTYETNYLINVAEYVMVIDKDTFVMNEDAIKTILGDMAKEYLFDDVGYSLKNYCNWGSRFTPNGEEMVILDYGYLYPLFGQNREDLFRCPKCGSNHLTWWTRVIGFLRPTKAFDKFRKIEESQRTYSKEV